MAQRRIVIRRPAGEDAREKLLRQIRELRQRIDPRLLEAARKALQGMQDAGFAPAATMAAPPGYVALDRGAIQRTVELFLAGRKDGGRFASELTRRLTEDATVH